MVFGRKQESTSAPAETAAPQVDAEPSFVIVGTNTPDTLKQAIAPLVTPLKVVLGPPAALNAQTVRSAVSVLTEFLSPGQLSQVRDLVIAERERRKDGTPTLILAVRTDQLAEFGSWFYESAAADRIQGVRLILVNNSAEIPEVLPSRLGAIKEPNIIKMPISPEVQNSGFRYLFAISPELRKVVTMIRGFAENGVTRVYMLGGPGTGKSTVAYYYYLVRSKGNFVQVNLTSESTGDKMAMKSLLCGHVAGSYPGAGTREGALSFARDGVCFLDETHGVTGVVMQVLMEVLDSGQYLPYGATAKRLLECAVLFASNRSWESLRSMIHLDEHARLGAALLTIPDLKKREEDLIAVMATTMSRFAGQCKTWRFPTGITPEAWKTIRNCTWRGNIRTLMRVFETASVSFATSETGSNLLDVPQITEGLNLWEPSDHKDLEMFVSY
jgi:hypothetical protein